MRFFLAMVSTGMATAIGLFSPTARAEGSAYDYTFTSIDGTPMPLKALQGKVILFVNTASNCGFTPQYSEMELLWQRYKDRGLVVIGVPSNDFGGQEPGDEAEIKRFTSNYSITFPLTSKVLVTGQNAHPFYQWAERELGPGAKPRWNFHKILISPTGQAVDWYASLTTPLSDKLTQAIEAQLAAPVKP